MKKHPEIPSETLRWWLSDLLSCPQTMIPWHETPTPEQKTAFCEAIARLVHKEPVQYVCGRAPFLEMTLKVTPAVLIPRPETEQLYQLMSERIPCPPGSILDVGTGSGCLAIALKRKWPAAQVTAIDISHEALDVARENAAAHSAEIRFLQGDLLTGQLPRSADLIVANLPYIGEKERDAVPADVRDFEPHLALFAGEDGTDLVLRLLEQAREVLRPDGWIFLETGETQTEVYQSASDRLGWSLQSFRDLAGRERFHVFRFRTP